MRTAASPRLQFDVDYAVVCTGLYATPHLPDYAVSCDRQDMPLILVPLVGWRLWPASSCMCRPQWWGAYA